MKWIKCKDALPEREGKYLVSIYAGEHQFVNIATFLPELNEGRINRKSMWIPETYGYQNHVIGWMNLPKPLMPGGDNE